MKDDKMADTKVDPYQDPAYHPPHEEPHPTVETRTPEEPHLAPEMQACINECLDCHKICLSTAMNHCLDAGGARVEPHHFRLMTNCAELCQTSANFMLSNSPLHAAVCGVCAQVCEACAHSCDEIEGMAECAIQCRKCAESCRKMAHMAASDCHPFDTDPIPTWATPPPPVTK